MDNIKQYFFSAEKNFAINKIKNILNWIMFNVPDLSILIGWKMLILRIAYFIYFLVLIGWLLTEGITLQSIIIRTLLATIVVAAVYINPICAMCYALLCKWETFYRKV